ncbi:putative endoglucanase precursor, partial [Basidiobolus meristosporus CBS 931.73]
HMEMIEPIPRRSKYGAGDTAGIDYDMTSPLDKERPYPCRGHREGPSVAEYSSGGSIRVKLAGSASHNGGHCQFSLSIDGGKTFIVTKTVLGNCMVGSLEYDVPIPNTAPNGKAVLGWTWINKTGNREYYMNCADITIKDGTGQCISGPKNFIANLPGYSVIPE